MGNCLSNKKSNEYLPVAQVLQVPPAYTYGYGATNSYPAPAMVSSPVPPPPMAVSAGSNDPKPSVDYYRTSSGWNDPPAGLFDKRR